ncbi:MAG: hypothetical protein DWQ02_01240 [Bacteroidetes bacterium]|nr:MAG: hypothetical protein DWQ02_01240 [Bacteroidota bacterium]
MHPDLRALIDQYKSLQEVKKHLEELVSQQQEQQQLLDALLPWVREKELILENSATLFKKIFGKKEAELNRIRDEHHRMSLRAKALEEKIALLEYEKNVLKEKLVQVPSVKYKIAKIVDYAELGVLDEESQLLIQGIRQLNEFSHQNQEVRKQVTEALNTGREAIQTLARIIQILKSSNDPNRVDPFLLMMNYDLYSASAFRRKALELVPGLSKTVQLWDDQIDVIAYHPKPDGALSEIYNESFFKSVIGRNFSENMPFDGMKRLENNVIYDFQKRMKALNKSLKSLQDEKLTFDQRLHELLLGHL